jgi:hypothetical protein
MKRRTLLVSALTLLGACASANRYHSDLGAIPGSEPGLQPRIASATSGSSTRLDLSFVVPQRSYVSVLRVHTQADVTVLAAPNAGSATALQAFDPGSHRLVLANAPIYLSANGLRAGRVVNRADATIAATDSPYPIHDYALVIATARPLAFDDIQAGLDGIDLRGPDDAVLARLAQAIGTQSGGAWSASAIRPSVQMAPF